MSSRRRCGRSSCPPAVSAEGAALRRKLDSCCADQSRFALKIQTACHHGHARPIGQRPKAGSGLCDVRTYVAHDGPQDREQFSRDECLNLNAEKIQRVNVLCHEVRIFSARQQFSNVDAAGRIGKFQAESHRNLPERRSAPRCPSNPPAARDEPVLRVPDLSGRICFAIPPVAESEQHDERQQPEAERDPKPELARSSASQPWPDPLNQGAYSKIELDQCSVVDVRRAELAHRVSPCSAISLAHKRKYGLASDAKTLGAVQATSKSPRSIAKATGPINTLPTTKLRTKTAMLHKPRTSTR